MISQFEVFSVYYGTSCEDTELLLDFSRQTKQLKIVSQLCPILCESQGFPILHHLLEFAQTHVHQFSGLDAIQPSHPLLSPSPPALNLSQLRGFSSGSALHIRWPNMGASASVPPMIIQGWFPLGLTGLISLLSKGLSRAFSNTTIWKHHFFGAQPYLWSNSHISVSAVLKEAKLLSSWASGFFVVLYGKEPVDPLVIFPLPHISCNYQNIWYHVSVNKTLCKSSDTGPNKALLSWKSILYQEYVSVTVKLNCFCFQNGMVQHS